MGFNSAFKGLIKYQQDFTKGTEYFRRKAWRQETTWET